MAAHDLVIRGGTVVDGTGAPGRTADVAISDGVVTEVGAVDGTGTREIDADGALVTPGFVDIHTHYDGQATWDEQLTPSCWHGVTTVVMGNCGVGFAPVAPGSPRLAHRPDGGRGGHPRRRAVGGHRVGLGELPRVPRRPRQAPPRDGRRHPGAPRRRAGLRDGRPRRSQRGGYARRHRGDGRHRARRASKPERSASRRARTLAHRAIDGEPVPGTFAAEDELFGIGRVLGELGTGVFELAPAGIAGEDLAAPEREMDWMRRLAAAIGRPVTFAMSQNNNAPDAWRKLLELAEEARLDGVAVRPADARPHRVAVARLPDVPPAAVHERVARLGPRPDAVAGAGGPHRARARAAGGARRRRGTAAGQRHRQDVHAPRPDLRAGRPARVRAGRPSAAPLASPPPRAWTSGSC